jgi:predicted metal-dependent phosphoesterase TrpH
MDFQLYDLHCHSNASDGALAPKQLFELALEKGIHTLALTDHDTVKGYVELIDSQGKGELSPDIKLLSGAEFTCQLDSQVLHVIGLNIDVENDYLFEHLANVSELRVERAEKIAEKLAKRNIVGILPLVKIKAQNAQIGRPHFASVLCDLNIVETPAQAFKKYLGAGKVANVKVQWPELETVLDVIKQAGGISILAHPTKYNLTMSKLRRIIEVFKLYGGQAVEIGYPGINKEQQSIIKYEVLKHDLLVSAGSDFHTLENKWTELGRYPDLPAEVPHVLSRCL